jgi:hypothetical protein
MDDHCNSSHTLKSSKTLYLIRHGQSTHNAYAEQHKGEPFVDPYFFDSPLSPVGNVSLRTLENISCFFLGKLLHETDYIDEPPNSSNEGHHWFVL